MASEQTTVSSIETGINFRNPEIREIILMSVELGGTPEGLEKVRAWLNNHEGITTVTLFKFVVDNHKVISKCMMSFDKFISQIPIHEVIKKLIKRKVDEVEKDRISTDYLKGLMRDAESKVELETIYTKWTKTRYYTIKRLRDIADEMSRDRKNVNIAKIAGSIVSIAGAVGAVGSAKLLTGDAAVVGVVVGSAVSAAGGVEYAGASFVADQLAEGAKATAFQILKEDEENTDNFIKLLEKYREETRDRLHIAYMMDDIILRFRKLREDSVKVTIVIGDSVEEEVGYVQSATTDSEKIDGEWRNIIRITIIGGVIVTRFIGEAAKTVGTFGVGLVASLVIATDIYSIVRTAIEMSKGSPDEAAEMIRYRSMWNKHRTDLLNQYYSKR